MSFAQITLLGFIAGGTIAFGLPMGRLQNPRLGVKAFLSALATGILVFLLVDVLGEASGTVSSAGEAHHWGFFSAYATLFVACTGLGLLGLVGYDRWIAARRRSSALGPGAASEAEWARGAWIHSLSPARSLALLIATGIGLHNFAEGLAIGQSAASGETQLAVVLVVGFALHNSTEGFGIVAPLAGEQRRPRWRFLAFLGFVGGAPTLVGTLIGQAWTSPALAVAFLSLAGGSILYVIVELCNVNRAFGKKTLVTWGVALGLFLGFATDWVLGISGA
jgi:zinc transporter, ZIP family